jgi:dTDP-4-dehydrorhamnose 3,5-epimerase
VRVTRTAIVDVLILEPKVFGDDRGFFMESYNERAFRDTVGRDVRFVQDNHSRSAQGVLRGLHFQRPPHAQEKLVRVTSGAVFDVAVDMRRSSPTFGRWVGTELSAANRRQMWIPVGFAHGFLVLTPSADVLYKTTDYYAPASEGAVRWDDPTIAVVWPNPGARFQLSEKDRNAASFAQAPPFD